MAGKDRDCRIVGESLAGERPVDEQTSVSMEVLVERLERLKQSGRLFAGVSLSGHAEGLRRRTEALAVG